MAKKRSRLIYLTAVISVSALLALANDAPVSKHVDATSPRHVDSPTAGGLEAPVPADIEFNRDVRPILSDNCFFCHGPDKNKRKADLRLDTKGGLFSTIKDHHTVVAGKPAESELFRLITTGDPEQRMPDPKSNKRLSAREIAVLKRWIEQGAPWEGHWAYLKPTAAQPPRAEPTEFVRNDIDRFVLQRLTESGLTPASPADKATLIRRLSFDLTGLPPAPGEVDAFLADNSPDAYEKLVDRLLASPHFGERMAVFWLDLVRYADSIGYHSDNPMNVSPYRDYVIDAFNQNKPFDQFTTEQLAGDLLPGATVEQKVASAYNRLLQTTEEGGAQPREYEVKYLTDRVRSVSTVWMASTMGCCQCHDHKFDPFTMRDFYSMGAFFADVQEASTGRREAGMSILTQDQARESRQLDEAMAAAKQKLDQASPELASEQKKWEAAQTPVDWTPLQASAEAVNGTRFDKRDDGSIAVAPGAVPAKETYTLKVMTDAVGVTAIRLEAMPDNRLPAHGPGAAENGNFVLTAVAVNTVDDHGKSLPVALSRATADFSQDGYPVAGIIVGVGPGWAVMPRFGQPHSAVIEFKTPLAESHTALTVTLRFESRFAQHQIGRLRLSSTTSASPAGQGALPPEVRAALAVAAADRSAEQKQRVAAYFRSIAPSLAPQRDAVAALEKKKQALDGSAPRCLVTVAGGPRSVRVLHRGNWMDTTGEEVTPAIPAFLAGPASGDTEKGKTPRLTRLDLARWIVSDQNPLTARVYVNRIWRLYFGAGLSKVLDDLGAQGEWPTHPRLLDCLAVRFMHGPSNAGPGAAWDTKGLIRLIVTSGAYRQSSMASDVDRERDPYNRLLSHQSRWRLDAEFVRDNALAVSGLLVDHTGGASVRPYQPAGYWDQLNFPTRTYAADKGDDQYRRGLYTWWQRSFLHPSLAAFDAPSREEGVCERNRSNIPQQALVLLNDPTYVEVSRVFAARVLRDGGATVEEKLKFAYRVALNRPPRVEEIAVLTDLLARHEKQYADDPGAAVKLLAIGDAPSPKDVPAPELAAWTSVARVILNLHETITRM